MEKRFAGIDVSKETLDVALLPAGLEERFANTEAGIQKLVSFLQKHGATHAVMEATGGLELDAGLAIAQGGMVMSIVNPRQIRRFAEAIGRLEKTDRIDAMVIAMFAQAVPLRETVLPDEQQRFLMALVSRRRQLTEMVVAESNRLASCRAGKVRKQIEETIVFLRRQIRQLDKDIDTQVRSSPLWKEDLELLQSIPGVGRITASTFIADLPEMRTLDERKLAKLVGVAPLPCDSGAMKGKRAIYGGRASVRAKLYMAALVATKHNPAIRTYYARLLAKGKEKMVAIVACMHKLLDIARSILCSRKPWREMSALAP
jgi:transposase